MSNAPFPSVCVSALGNVAVQLMRTANDLAQACADYEDDRREAWWAEQEPARRSVLIGAAAQCEAAAAELPDALAAMRNQPTLVEAIEMVRSLVRASGPNGAEDERKRAADAGFDLLKRAGAFRDPNRPHRTRPYLAPVITGDGTVQRFDRPGGGVRPSRASVFPTNDGPEAA